MRFNAYILAKSWQSVALASADDDGRPALYRSTLIEEFEFGVRLVATDGYVLFRAWVPFEGREDEEQPPLSDLPVSVAVCADRDKRVLGLMKYLVSHTKDDKAETDVTVDVSIVEGDDQAKGTLEGLAGSQIRMHVTSAYDEAIESPVFEGAFPNWRPLWEGHLWTSTARFGLSAHTLTKLGKLSAIWSKSDVEFRLGGKVGVAKVLVNAPEVTVDGLVMPIRLVSEVPESDEVTVESEIAQFAEALDDWLADVLEPPMSGDDDDEAPPPPDDPPPADEE